MDYILSGNASEVAKVIPENRIRVERGVIKFTPASIGADTKDLPANDTKDVPTADVKETPAAQKTSRRSKKTE